MRLWSWCENIWKQRVLIYGEKESEGEKQSILSWEILKSVDTIHMTKTNINKDQIKFENLHKSFFSDIKNTSCLISSDSVVIQADSKSNSDPASVELSFKEDNYLIYFWDGYSLAEKTTVQSYENALVVFKKFAKKLAKNLRRY